MRAHHVNFRYILLEDGKEYFLLDKLPTLWGYFFPYLNWFSNRTLYRLTETQFWEIRMRKKHWLETLLIPAPIFLAVSVWAGRLRTSDSLYAYLNSPRFSFTERWIYWFLAFILAVILANLIHFLSSRSLEKKFDFSLYKKEKGKIRLTKLAPWMKKQFKGVLILNFLIFLFSFFILNWGTLAFLIFHCLILLMSTLLAGDLSYSENCQYTIERDEKDSGIK